jgi:hypothetical protein
MASFILLRIRKKFFNCYMKGILARSYAWVLVCCQFFSGKDDWVVIGLKPKCYRDYLLFEPSLHSNYCFNFVFKEAHVLYMFL